MRIQVSLYGFYFAGFPKLCLFGVPCVITSSHNLLGHETLAPNGTVGFPHLNWISCRSCSDWKEPQPFRIDLRLLVSCVYVNPQ